MKPQTLLNGDILVSLFSECDDKLQRLPEMSLGARCFPLDRRLCYYSGVALSCFIHPTCFQVFFLKGFSDRIRADEPLAKHTAWVNDY